ncbi:glycogen debranching enzyme GlgX [Siculibacillus lacustris]|uniref:4-alpha-glucanotransferase n=1 Tax=Siculibacillus lacustris TaxID=1549641 RepID=A0A4Q9VFM1_9HYPH|nr:glycogen debranching protein GlgX [Siculibacillus lacustris]TBW33715.1 glycogen debranching enzyme GlgX [Siculibacillus lacustris]
MIHGAIGPGATEPLGVTHDGEGVNVAVVSANGTAVDFCVYDATGDREIERIRLPSRTGPVFHGRIDGLPVGTRYGLRVDGPWNPADGHRFNPAKLIVDPYAQKIDRPFRLHPALFDQRARGAAEDRIDSGIHVPKAIVEAPEPLQPVIRPRISPKHRVVYELHVKGFTQLHPDIPEAIRGTFAGLAHPAAIAHLIRLGINVVEVMPIWAWLDERHLAPLGLTNYWGYNPITPLAPDPRLAPGGWSEIRTAIDALHEVGIAVILDVVLNHTGESDHHGPTVSLRGLDNALYYRTRTDDRSRYVDDAGCGNVPALDRQAMMRIGLEALRVSALRGGFDGFRYDLATTLGRRRAGFDAAAPFLAALEQDPVLRTLIHIAEPWDIGPGGYQLGAFPATWGEWNDRYRDTMRRFWRGDEGLVGDLATRLAGSSDVFAGRRRKASDSVNYVTAHDGFTLADLVSYTGKHNLANGENNRDGSDANQSWNHGVEGPSSDPAIVAARARDVRALIATLLGSRGTPMLSMGDECGRTQGGNNNAYAQDNAISWFDWSKVDSGLVDFTRRLLDLRRAHPALHDDKPPIGEPVDDSGLADVEWRHLDGRPLAARDWHDPENYRLAAVFTVVDHGGEFDRVAVVVSADLRASVFIPPMARSGHRWRMVLDSAHPDREPVAASKFAIDGRAVVFVVEEPVPEEVRAVRADPRTLDRLARTAGIAPEWWDNSGNCVKVGDDTKRAVLAAMGLPATTLGEARDSYDRLIAETTGRPLPFAQTVFSGAPCEVPLGGAPSRGLRSFALEITDAIGEARGLVVQPGDGRTERVTTADGRVILQRRIALPDLPLGRYTLRIDGSQESTALTVAPRTTHLPAEWDGDVRSFGIATHLYALRSAGDQGIGDFTTLGRTGAAAAAVGAVTIGLNPIHALFPQDRERASPYSPSDRRFLDPIYIDVTRLPEALASAVETDLAAAAPIFGRLAGLAHIDYTAVWAAKVTVLDAAFRAFEALRERRPGDGLVAAFLAFVVQGGEGLERFATFEAIAAEHGASTASGFPSELATSESSGVIGFRLAHARAVERSMFLQWLAATQFAEAATRSRAAGLDLGFYRDLAVGCAPDGAEAWGAGDQLMRAVSIGAPPDPFSPDGQVWSLPPPNPYAWARTGYRAFSELIRANMAHAGALRIDHVLGLRRLFLVPDGARGGEGAYVDQPFDDLLGQLTLESRRAGCVVVGEDLGTVPWGFRERLAEAKVLSYQVLWFERDGRDFMSPTRYPRLGAACVATHDLATLAGWWEGTDIVEMLRLGTTSAEALAQAAEDREQEKRLLVDSLIHVGLLSVEWDEELLDDGMPAEIAAAIHAWISGGRSVLALVQADDLAGETERLNLPGTDRQRPNWRRRLALDDVELFESPLARAILAGFAARRRAPR